MGHIKIGDFIQLSKLRNEDTHISRLLGVNLGKQFMPSVARLDGVDLSKYKVIKKGQFGCKLMSVGRDEKVPISRLTEYDEAIISSAYFVFEVKDKNILDPEYLMMWISRSEADRYQWFQSGGDIRGRITWDEFCNLPIIVPSLEKQREIVKEYNTIVNRIKLNEQLNQKLEETAQALYKHWFVDFEFPNENGQPYKSSGGKMIYNNELDQEIPEWWENINLEYVIELFDSKRIPLSRSERDSMSKIYPYYGAGSLMDYVEDYIFDGTFLLLGEDGSVITEKGNPVLQYVWGKFWVNNHAHVLQAKNGFTVNSLYMLLSNTRIEDIITGGVQAKINQTNLRSVKTILPDKSTLEKFNIILESIFNYKKKVFNSTSQLIKMKEIILSRMSKVETLQAEAI